MLRMDISAIKIHCFISVSLVDPVKSLTNVTKSSPVGIKNMLMSSEEFLLALFCWISDIHWYW